MFNVGNLISRFKSDTKGNFGIMAATTILALLSGVGLSVDGQRFYTHSSKAQSVADAAGLSAAIFVGNNGIIPNHEAPGVFIQGQAYSATDLGFELANGENISFSVEYDNTEREVVVTTTGTMTPIMLQLVGKTAVTTTNRSVIKYSEPNEINAASILFVLDNSGSMLFDDVPLAFDVDDISEFNSTEQWFINALINNQLSRNTARIVVDFFSQEDAFPRVDALKANMTVFNNQLISLIDSSNSTDDFLRTGLITYNNNIIRERPINWGPLDQVQDIDNMSPINGTNSSVAFTKAVQDFADEDTQHLNENGSLDPSKYLVFMSDGQNTDSTSLPDWLAVPAVAPTGLFRIFREARCIRFNRFGRCREFTAAGFEEWDVDIHGVGTNAMTPNEAGLAGDWEEGRYVSPGDAATIADCTTLKNQGVTIYTIGFALDTGTFDTNTWADLFNPYRSDRQVSNINEDGVERAFSLLDACATDESTFLLANDAADLSIAFAQIRAQISEDIVRLQE